MRRWIAIALGLVLAGGAALGWYAVRAGRSREPAGPQAEIDPDSRAALEKILEEVDRHEAREPAESDR